MAIDDDPLAIQLHEAKQQLDAGIERELAAATVAGVLYMIPGVGSAIQSLLDRRARENVKRALGSVVRGPARGDRMMFVRPSARLQLRNRDSSILR